MKQFLYFLPLFFVYSLTHAQSASAQTEVLNNYLKYCNSLTTPLKEAEHHFHEYNEILNRAIRKNYPVGDMTDDTYLFFKDDEVFDVGVNDPETLYQKALKQSVTLQAADHKLLNDRLKRLHKYTAILLADLDSLNDFCHAPERMISYGKHTVPYRWLYLASQHMKEAEECREHLMKQIQEIYYKNYYKPSADYLNSVELFRPAFQECKSVLDILYNDDSTNTNILVHKKNLDSLVFILEKNELKNLKNIPPQGHSRAFNGGNRNGDDLYHLHETLTDELKSFSGLINDYLNAKSYPYAYRYTKCHYYYNEIMLGFYNQNGLVDDYVRYIQLISGKKLRVLTPLGWRMYGWGHSNGKSLPDRPALLWSREFIKFVPHQ